MAERKAEPIKLALDVAKRREDAAASEFAKMKNLLEKEEERLSILLKYEDEYLAQLIKNAAQSISGNMYYNQQLFVDNIKHAITIQRNKVDEVTHITKNKQEAWLSLSTKTNALNKVLEGILKEKMRKENRREQLFHDELSQRIRKEK